jgi:hypothetical protein
MADRAKPAAAASPTASESPVAGGRGQRRKGPDRAAQPRYRAVCWLIGGSGPIEPCHQILQGAVAAAVAGGAAGLLAGMDLVGPDLDDDTVRIAGHLAGSCPAQSYPSVRLDRPKCRSSPTRRTAVSALNRLETWPRSVTGPGTPHGSAARSGHWSRRGAARSHQSMVSASAVMRSRRPAMNSRERRCLRRSRTSRVLRRHGGSGGSSHPRHRRRSRRRGREVRPTAIRGRRSRVRHAALLYELTEDEAGSRGSDDAVATPAGRIDGGWRPGKSGASPGGVPVCCGGA